MEGNGQSSYTKGVVNENSRFKAKHTLDSDEEDNADNYDMLKDDDIEGQEENTVDYDDGIQITPFNMQEEMEEGHFDSHGMYIPDKNKEIQDSWMDNIDWVKVQERPGGNKGNDDSDDSEDEPEKIDEIPVYRLMIELMQPKESVVKSIRRLGGGKAAVAAASASQRWKTKKQKSTDTATQPVSAKDRESMLQLTEYADRLLSNGNLEIYQDTREKLEFKVKLVEDKEKASKPVIPDDIDDDDALDMFASDLDKKDVGTSKESSDGEPSKICGEPSAKKVKFSKDESPEVAVAEKTGKDEPATEEKSDKDASSDEVRWFYKWDNEDDAELHGPYLSSEMAAWVEGDHFPDGVFVRKEGATGQFYSSRRIDFELYTDT